MTVIMQALAAAPSALPSDSSALEACISALKSSISALESSLNTLEASSAPWECLAIVSAFLVFFGIVGEIIVIVSEDRENKEDWARGIVRPPDRAPRWRFWFDIVATVVVLLGVLGEAGASMQLAFINSHLRSKTSVLRADSDQLVALVTQEAGTAAANANRAQGSADDVAGKAKQLRANLKKATADIRSAESEAASARAENLATKKTLEQERNTRLELEKSLYPRELRIVGYSDHTSSIDELKKYIRTPVSLEYIPDFEAQRAARLIASVLDQAGWKIVGVKENGNPAQMYRDGVSVERYNPPDRGDLAVPENFKLWQSDMGEMRYSEEIGDAVIDFLLGSNWIAEEGVAGRSTDLPPKNDIPPRSIRIRVGFKPNPFFSPFGKQADRLKAERDVVNAMRKMMTRTEPSAPKVPTEAVGVSPWFPPEH